jgi:hypothetical protein
MHDLRTFVFKRKEKSKWTDILNDPAIRKWIVIKIIYEKILFLQLSNEIPVKMQTYIHLKWGEELIDAAKFIPNRTPQIYVDYYPKKRPSVSDLGMPLKLKK